MRYYFLSFVALATLCSCEDAPTPPPSNPALAPLGTEAEQPNQDAPQAPEEDSGPPTLPAPPWTGILVRGDAIPQAPTWATPTVQVVERDGQRFMLAVGQARGMQSALARSTAEARARANIAHWLNTELLAGSKPVQFAETSAGTFAQVEMPLSTHDGLAQ